MYYLVLTEAKQLRERYEIVDGVRLRYFVGGQGPPLVLLHGLGGAASNWVELAPLLVPRFRLLIPELPGHGRSEPARSARSLDPYAEQGAALMELEQMPSAPVVRH